MFIYHAHFTSAKLCHARLSLVSLTAIYSRCLSHNVRSLPFSSNYSPFPDIKYLQNFSHALVLPAVSAESHPVYHVVNIMAILVLHLIEMYSCYCL